MHGLFFLEEVKMFLSENGKKFGKSILFLGPLKYSQFQLAKVLLVSLKCGANFTCTSTNDPKEFWR